MDDKKELIAKKLENRLEVIDKDLVVNYSHGRKLARTKVAEQLNTAKATENQKKFFN